VQYLELENLTLIPLCCKLIDVSLLSPEQIRYIDDFHDQCRRVLEPLLEQRCVPHR
jgi:Xaa-Pro aminopeptidase